MSGLGVPRVSPLPSAGRGVAAFFAGPTVGTPGSTPFPSPRAGVGRSHVLSPSPYLGVPDMTAGRAQGPGEAMDTEGAGQASETGASSTMTDQDCAQAGSRPSPQ